MLITSCSYKVNRGSTVIQCLYTMFEQEYTVCMYVCTIILTLSSKVEFNIFCHFLTLGKVTSILATKKEMKGNDAAGINELLCIVFVAFNLESMPMTPTRHVYQH